MTTPIRCLGFSRRVALIQDAALAISSSNVRAYTRTGREAGSSASGSSSANCTSQSWARSASIRRFCDGVVRSNPTRKIAFGNWRFPSRTRDASATSICEDDTNEDRRYIFSSSTTHREKACASMLLSLRTSCNAIRYRFMASHACCACLAKPAIDIVCAAAASRASTCRHSSVSCASFSNTRDSVPHKMEASHSVFSHGSQARICGVLQPWFPAARCCWLYRCRSARAARTVLGITAVPSIFRCNASNKSCSVRISHRAVAIFNGDISTLYDAAAVHQSVQPFRWYPLAMRRWSAWALLLLTALLPLQPLLASAQADASLPACCRRNGAHHCMMLQAMTMADSGTQFFVHSSPCPFWKLAVNPAVVAASGAAPTLPSRPAIAEDVVIAAPSFLFFRLARSRSARAPPTALLSIPVSQA